MIDFQDPRTIAAARAYVDSVVWRLGVGALFALGASLVFDSLSIGFSWFLAVALSTGFDAMLGRSYIDARGQADRRTTGGLFVWGSAFSVMVFSAMTLHVAGAGGGPGRVLAVLMAASAFVSAMIFLFRARRFMMITAAPAAVCLLTIPFLPLAPGAADIFQSALGAACGVAGFLAYVWRAATHNTRLLDGLRAANREANARRAEAETKRAEAEEANRAKTEFLTVMTHELRTPLNAVIGYAEIIVEDMIAAGCVETAHDAERIGKSARHLLGLIDQILNMTNADAGHAVLASRDVNVRELLEGVLGILRDEMRTNGNRVSLHIGDGAEWAFTDGEKLGVCMSALLSNAAKFTKDGLVAVSAEHTFASDREWLTVAVSDTGVGIAKEHMDHIFKPFTQVENAATRKIGGIGLGLAVARRMAVALGGEICVSSEPGKGSTFVVRVPQRVAAPAAALEARAAA